MTQTFEPGGSSELWTIDAERGLSSRLTPDSREKAAPIWSPDGRSIAFTDTRDLLRTSATGDGRIEIISPGSNLRLVSDWSSDGTTLLYSERFPDTRSDLITTEITLTGKLKDGAQPLRTCRHQQTRCMAAFHPSKSRTGSHTNPTSPEDLRCTSIPTPSVEELSAYLPGGTYPKWGPISGSRGELAIPRPLRTSRPVGLSQPNLRLPRNRQCVFAVECRLR